jgi:hypothetical protein
MTDKEFIREFMIGFVFGMGIFSVVGLLIFFAIPDIPLNPAAKIQNCQQIERVK